jgi:hypothetical protein
VQEEKASERVSVKDRSVTDADGLRDHQYRRRR